MFRRVLLTVILIAAPLLYAQQVSDPDYNPAIKNPAYQAAKGPRILIDAAHHNFHTVDGRYEPLARLLRRDGYQVAGSTTPFTADSLKSADVLVIANAMNAVNSPPEGDWTLPTPSAFTRDEIAAVKQWVENGGALFLIVDHMPMPGAAGDLARAFGVEFSNGFAVYQDEKGGGAITFTLGKAMKPGPWSDGRSPDEKVDTVTNFTGSAFYPGPSVKPVLVLSEGFVSLTPYAAWEFKPETPRVPITGWCQGAVLAQGKGRVAVFGEAAMFTAQLAGAKKTPVGMNSPDAKQNYQFLLNLMHWLTRLPGLPED
jgi:hypothetical protein